MGLYYRGPGVAPPNAGPKTGPISGAAGALKSALIRGPRFECMASWHAFFYKLDLGDVVSNSMVTASYFIKRSKGRGLEVN